MSTKYAFLAPAWIAAVAQVRDDYQDRVTPPTIIVRANVVVTGPPFGDGDVLGSIDTSSGQLALDVGHVDRPDLTITTDYATARALFVEQDQQAVMQAVLSGRIKIAGDVTKLLALQLPLNEPASAAIAMEVAARIQAFTE